MYYRYYMLFRWSNRSQNGAVKSRKKCFYVRDSVFVCLSSPTDPIYAYKIVIKVIAEEKIREIETKPYVKMRNMCERLVLCVHLCGHQSHQLGIFYKCLALSCSIFFLLMFFVGIFYPTFELSSLYLTSGWTNEKKNQPLPILLLLWMIWPFPLRTTKAEKRNTFTQQTSNRKEWRRKRSEKNGKKSLILWQCNFLENEKNSQCQNIWQLLTALIHGCILERRRCCRRQIINDFYDCISFAKIVFRIGICWAVAFDSTSK